MRRTLFFESDHATMSGRLWIMWTGNCRDVFRSAETFKSLALFSCFMLGFFVSSQDIHLPWETELWVPWLLWIADLLSHIVLSTILLSLLIPCYVTMCIMWYIYIYIYRRCPWCNGSLRMKWTQRYEFKSWTRVIAFHIALIPLGKVWIQLFSLQLWVNSRAG